MLYFEHFLERPSCALNFDFFLSCSFLFPRIAIQGLLTLSSSVAGFLSTQLSSSEGGAESWLARLHPLSSPAFLPVPFPCQGSFFTLPFSLLAGFECRASCHVPCESEPISQTTVPAKALSSARFLPHLPTCYIVLFLLGLNIHSLSCVCIFSFHLFSTCLRARPSYR